MKQQCEKITIVLAESSREAAQDLKEVLVQVGEANGLQIETEIAWSPQQLRNALSKQPDIVSCGRALFHRAESVVNTTTEAVDDPKGCFVLHDDDLENESKASLFRFKKPKDMHLHKFYESVLKTLIPLRFKLLH